jgi:regulator of cell morphogenesis and NO signaling
MKTIDFANSKVGQIVVEDYRTAEVFKKFGIDFCCGGKKLLSKACTEKEINLQDVETALEAATVLSTQPSNDEFSQWPLDKLADYIVNRHHTYVRESTPILLEFTAKIARVHGDGHPELLEIQELFTAIAEELQLHMQKEEHVLFPFVKNLVEAKENNMALSGVPSIANPIGVMENDHEVVGKLMERIKTLSNNYVFPENACNSYRFTFAKLQEFENDLHQHIHLENNILFVKAQQIENELNK